MGPGAQGQETGCLELRADCWGLGIGTGVWILGAGSVWGVGFEVLGGLYLELEFKAEGLYIWTWILVRGVGGAVGKTSGPLLGSAQVGVRSAGPTLTFQAMPFGVRWLTGPPAPRCVCPFPRLCPLGTRPEPVSVPLGPTLRPSPRSSSPLSPLHLSQHLSVSRYLSVSVFPQHLCLCLPLAGFRSD